MADKLESTWIDKRKDTRITVNEYYSLEMSFEKSELVYRLKIWNISKGGFAVIVKDDSEILQYLKCNDEICVKYYTEKSPSKPEILKTKIKHISKGENNAFRGHHLIGLEIIEKKLSVDVNTKNDC
ncbi:MAG: hypothetical protein HQK76_13915 [Desulfobacterales bacterium]|nr:hypothetical protein [Desulfobacterales bacterium]